MNKFIDSMKMWQKFALIGVFVLALFGVPFYLYISNLNANISSIKTEKLGSVVMPSLVLELVLDNSLKQQVHLRKEFDQDLLK